jgi:hypothetical protein
MKMPRYIGGAKELLVKGDLQMVQFVVLGLLAAILVIFWKRVHYVRPKK